MKHELDKDCGCDRQILWEGKVGDIDVTVRMHDHKPDRQFAVVEWADFHSWAPLRAINSALNVKTPGMGLYGTITDGGNK